MPATCRSCHRSIIWMRTVATDSLIPLDAVPNPDGNVVAALGRPGYCETLGPLDLELDGRERYMPHHATCPEKERWKR